MCTFAHDLVMMFVSQLQIYQIGLTPARGISPFLFFFEPCMYGNTHVHEEITFSGQQ